MTSLSTSISFTRTARLLTHPASAVSSAVAISSSPASSAVAQLTKHGLETWHIALIATFSAVFALGLAIVGAYLCLRRRRNRDRENGYNEERANLVPNQQVDPEKVTMLIDSLSPFTRHSRVSSSSSEKSTSSQLLRQTPLAEKSSPPRPMRRLSVDDLTPVYDPIYPSAPSGSLDDLVLRPSSPSTSRLPLLHIPEPISRHSTRSKRSARRKKTAESETQYEGDSDDSESMYSQASASTMRGGAWPRDGQPDIPPVPRLPALEVDLQRQDTRVIANLLQSRARRGADSPPPRNESLVSHIEREGSI